MVPFIKIKTLKKGQIIGERDSYYKSNFSRVNFNSEMPLDFQMERQQWCWVYVLSIKWQVSHSLNSFSRFTILKIHTTSTIFSFCKAQQLRFPFTMLLAEDTAFNQTRQKARKKTLHRIYLLDHRSLSLLYVMD